MLKTITRLVNDPDPGVRRECAVALRFLKGPRADALWADLAGKITGKDRWEIEALGIGADLDWESRLARYLAVIGSPQPAILWRSRAPATSTWLAKYVLEADSPKMRDRMLRAFHFQPDGELKSSALMRVFAEGDAETATAVAVNYLSAGDLLENPKTKRKIDQLARKLRGTAALVHLADRLGLDHLEKDLLAFATAHPDAPEAVTAARLALANPIAITAALRTAKNPAESAGLLTTLGRTGDKRAVKFLQARLLDAASPLESRQAAAAALAGSRPGENTLLNMARENRIKEDMKFTVATQLGRSRDAKIRKAVADALDLPPAPGTENFPPVAELVQMKGHPGRGKQAFTKATCATCHQINNDGIDFGPNLTETGNKLSREGLFEAILYPSNAIAHGFEGVNLQDKSDGQFTGFIISDTPDALTLRVPGGLAQSWKKSDIAETELLGISLMPAGLAAILTPGELADLVAYLQSLK